MKKRLSILLAAAIITNFSATAQTTSGQNTVSNNNEFTLHAGGGLSSLQYKLNTGKYSPGFGGQAGFGYIFFFSSSLGFVTGAELSLYKAKSVLSGFSDSYEVHGAKTADNYTYTFAFDNYSEIQQAFYINIPLMLQYQSVSNNQFYAAFGVKAGIPVKVTAMTDDYSVSTKGYFHDAEVRTYDDLPQYGFGTYNCASDKKSLDFALNLMAAAEAGVKWKIASKNALYTGVYVDYGFINIQKTKNSNFVQRELTEPEISPLIVSQYAGESFTDKITLLSVGIRLRVAFGAGKSGAKLTKQQISANNAEKAKERRAAAEKARAERVAKDKENKRIAAEKAEAERIAKEQETERLAKERLQDVIDKIQQPIYNYVALETEFSTAQRQELDEKIALLKKNPNIKFFIYGHTCDTGSSDVNEKISLQRAQKAKEYMISKGIDGSRILGVNSKRDTEPLVPNTSEENRKKNRRIQIVVEN